MITIRQVNSGDVEQIVSLESQLFGADAWSAQLVHDELSASHRHYIVAVDEQDAVRGYAGLFAPGAEGDIQTIAVIPELRGQGVGRALMETLIEEARRRKVEQLFLEVRADNAVARALYDTLGFEIIGERPGYYQPGNVAAVVMRKRVSAHEPA